MKNKLIAIILVVILIASGFVIYNQMFQEEEIKDEPKKEKTIDDRVSPYNNQGLIVEILRIRNRELMDRMLKFDTSWKSPPTFYWIVNVDGKEHIADTIWSAGGVEGTGAFTEWDNFGKESKGNFYVEQEQKTSEVTILVMEQVKSGLFGRNVEAVEKERIGLTYDYRIGHWVGSDYLKDEDGYGHVLGEEYEIWFNLYQSDNDYDGIPYWTEVNILGTDPTMDDSKRDPDGDGTPTSWEWKWGYDPNTYDNHDLLDPDVDGLENIEEYKMQKYFADPYHQDIYIEIDGMEKGGLLDWDHVSWDETQQMVIERFAQHNINVYFDDGWPDGPVNGGGELLPYMKVNDDTVGHFHNKFYVHNFADERKGIFRYCIVAVNAGFISPGDYNHYDHIVVDTGPHVTLKRLGFTPKYRRVLLAKGILHELGHSIGLMPTSFYGVDILTGDQQDRWPTQLTEEEYENYCEQYYSIMNYGYIFGSTVKQIRCFDYSDGSNDAQYDQNDWEHIYLPAFQIDHFAYEEAQPTIDETMEDMEVVIKNSEAAGYGWEFNGNLTNKHIDGFSCLTFVTNVDCQYRIYVKNVTDASEKERNIRIYAKPKVEPTNTVWSLVTEGNYNSQENTIKFYSFDELYEEVIYMIK